MGMRSTNIADISKTMDKFEEQFEQMDMGSQYMEQAIDQSTAQTMPANEVDSLMAEIADENGLDFESQLANTDLLAAKSKNQNKETEKESKADDLEARLQKLGDI